MCDLIRLGGDDFKDDWPLKPEEPKEESLVDRANRVATKIVSNEWTQWLGQLLVDMATKIEELEDERKP